MSNIETSATLDSRKILGVINGSLRRLPTPGLDLYHPKPAEGDGRSN